MNWLVEIWRNAGLWQEAPHWFLILLSLICIYLFVILPSGALIAYADRKLGADLQARVGPNRAGWAGILQPLADLLKLLQKEEQEVWNWREAIWFSIHTMALYSTVAVLPLGSLALLLDTDMSAFLPFWAALVLGFGTMLLGLGQGSVPGWFGGVRVAAQALTGTFPALVAMMCAGVQSGGFKWSLLAENQGGSPFSWTIFSSPFQFIAFVVFVISGLVILGIPPLDAGLSESDIHGGVAAHLSGRRLVLFRLGRFYGFFLWAEIAVVLFLGAWSLPFHLHDTLLASNQILLVAALELICLLAKTFSLMVLVIWVAKVTPRGRVDQVTDFSWKVLSPLGLFALVGTSLWVGWRSMS